MRPRDRVSAWVGDSVIEVVAPGRGESSIVSRQLPGDGISWNDAARDSTQRPITRLAHSLYDQENINLVRQETCSLGTD